MCWLKGSLDHKKVEINSAFVPIGSDKKPCMDIQTENSCDFAVKDDSLCQMTKILKQLMTSNSQAINCAIQLINQTEMRLEASEKQIEGIVNKEKEQSYENIQEIGNIPPFLEQLFGRRTYHYKLKLVHQIPKTLYKQRNFNFEVQLLDSKGNIVKNGNPIPIYFGVCTKNGEWLHENRSGQNMIKGKNQIQLYQGRASFQKIYLRQVSKPYQGGKFKFIVYPKNPLVKFSTYKLSEKKIDSEVIMPAIADNITILAKKRSKC